MKNAFWFLSVAAAGLIAVTISETHKLGSAYRELDKSMALNAQVTSALIKAQRSTAVAQDRQSTRLPARP
jgi:hypothetical protein